MKITVTKLDKLFSEFIRSRDKVCKRCGQKGRLETAHFFGRRMKSVRWDEDNAVALCFACHRFFHEHPLEHGEWYLDYLGSDKLKMLRARAYIPQKPDLNAISLYLKSKLNVS